MRRYILFVLPLALLLGGCHSSSPAGNHVQPAQPHVPPVASAPASHTVGRAEQVTQAVNALLLRQSRNFHPILPKGTRLLEVEINRRVAVLNFSHQFNNLADMGDTTEAEAQAALRKAVGTVAGVKQMSVQVEGKPFDSQMTDWTTPFDVDYHTQTAGKLDGNSTP